MESDSISIETLTPSENPRMDNTTRRSEHSRNSPPRCVRDTPCRRTVIVQLHSPAQSAPAFRTRTSHAPLFASAQGSSTDPSLAVCGPTRSRVVPSDAREPVHPALAHRACRTDERTPHPNHGSAWFHLLLKCSRARASKRSMAFSVLPAFCAISRVLRFSV